MNTSVHTITVSGLRVEVVRKAIKNLHLGVYPPDGRVRVAAPLAVKDDAVRLAVVTRLPSIRKQQLGLSKQGRQSRRRYVAGETHFVFGNGLGRRWIERDGAPGGVRKNARTLTLRVRPGSDLKTREKVILDWYRRQLRQA